MGRNIYFTDAEIMSLRETGCEWCEIMGSGDESSVKAVEDRMNEGLGSAMKKLYKGTYGEKAYRKY